MPTSTTAILQFLTTQSTFYARQMNSLAAGGTIFYQNNMTIFETASILVTIAIAIGIVMLIIKTNWLKSRVTRWRNVILHSDIPKQQAKRSWKDVERHFFAGDENDLKIAIIEADRTLDNALRDAGIFGASLGERLKKVKPAQLPNIEDVWQAHKLRNRIAHEGDLAVKRDIAERALTVYREALESLGALEK